MYENKYIVIPPVSLEKEIHASPLVRSVFFLVESTEAGGFYVLAPSFVI